MQKENGKPDVKARMLSSCKINKTF